MARRWLRFLRLFLIAYIPVVLVISALQLQMIFPGAATQGRAEACVRPSSDVEVVELSSSTGERVVAMFGKALNADGSPRADAATCPSMIYFYGNGMCMADCAGEFRQFRCLGVNVLIPDFLGYGMSAGRPGEQSVYATAETAWQHLVSRSDIDKTKIIAAGWSLGSAAAVELATKRPVKGLMIFSAFTSMKEMARRVAPFLPTSLMLKHHFANEIKLRHLKIPTLIVHGTRDSVVPFDMSKKLAAAAPHAQLYVVDGGEHNTLFEDGGDELWATVFQFVSSVR
ncbi:MAG TPA: alpha/beta hydrolase [Tepidisphaeraceae bacterium]|jgi:hypothetical protein